MSKIKITGTFLDEISHDIPHQNWGIKEWIQDFSYMKQIGINRVILIRSGYRKWLTYPSEILIKDEKAFQPYTDLVALFLELSEQFEMEFFFGLYDSGKYWINGNMKKEIELNKKVIQEVWGKYSKSPAFKGWYLSQECDQNVGNIIHLYAELGNYCKKISKGQQVLISPFMDGIKNISQYTHQTEKKSSIGIDQHYKDWEIIFSGIHKSVDLVAFQDGHVAFDELEEYMKVNKQLADSYGLHSWVNIESFDRDMPIKFLPIKWDKMRHKLEVAQRVGIQDAITFEFSHFMSPQSAYKQAGHLFNRYNDYLKLI